MFGIAAAYDHSVWIGRLHKGGYNMIELVVPGLEDLWFREKCMGDEETMAYNKKWGGTIDFPRSRWEAWYARWVANPQDKRFYRYILNEEHLFVGEAAYHLDESRRVYIADVIVMAKYRGKGYGSAGLDLLCDCAKRNGIQCLYDDIAADNPAIALFLRHGFREEYRTDDFVMLKKVL